MDYTDRATCILFGDGAGAVLLEPTSERRHDVGLLDFVHEVDGSGGVSLYHARRRKPESLLARNRRQEECTTFIRTAQQVFKFAVRKMSEACFEILQRNHLTGDDID